MGNKERWEYLRAIYGPYRAAGRKAKRVILSEFCANTGYHRKHAIRLLNGPRPEKRRTQRERCRGLSYSQETVGLLTAVWEAALTGPVLGKSYRVPTLRSRDRGGSDLI